MRAYFCDRQTFFSCQEAADLVAFMDLPTVDLSCHRGPEGWEPGSWQIPQSSSDLKRIGIGPTKMGAPAHNIHNGREELPRRLSSCETSMENPLFFSSAAMISGSSALQTPQQTSQRLQKVALNPSQNLKDK